jgi:hypothetical protein
VTHRACAVFGHAALRDALQGRWGDVGSTCRAQLIAGSCPWALAAPGCDDPQVSHPAIPAVEDVIDASAKVQFEAFLDQHRDALNACLDGLTEQQARRSLVSSKTTLLGLVKHATFVERVWFGEAVTCRSRDELGIPAGPDESFDLKDDDTIATVRQAHLEACQASREAVAALDLSALVRGNRRGPLPLRWVYMHVLRELAQHCGHADILREQLLDGGASD